MEMTRRDGSYSPDVQRYRDHIINLGRTHNVAIHECFRCGPDRGGANPADRSIHAPEIKNDTAYAVALHELGHLIEPGAAEGTANLMLSFNPADLDVLLKSEHLAWKWGEAEARRHGVWTPGMEHVKTICLQGYETGVADRRRFLTEFEPIRAKADALIAADDIDGIMAMLMEVLHGEPKAA